jgi:hypothetical protein
MAYSSASSSTAHLPRFGAIRRAADALRRLDEPVPIGPIVYFRIVFGLAMLAWITKAIAAGWPEQLYSEPALHFKYPGFAWVRAWPGDAMRWQFYLLAAASLALTVGLAYRASALAVAFAFTHLFLVDKTLYQNHHYLMCLLCWLAVVLPAGRALSVDAVLRPSISAMMAPKWCLWLLRFQVFVPYLYGGIAKLEADWLRGQPMRAALAAKTELPFIGPLLNEAWCVSLVVYGGLLFDLLVVPALLWRKTRPLAFVLALAFHLTNATLFDISVFPWLMGLLTALFFPAEFFQRLLRLEINQTASITPAGHDYRRSARAVNGAVPFFSARRFLRNALLAAYVAIQLLLPLRHFLYPGNVNWTEQGHCFSWHMMLRGKQSALRLIATDSTTGRAGTIDLRPYVREHQAQRMARDPALIYQLCQFVARDLVRRGFNNVEVRAISLVSLNGRKPQLLIDPTVDLASAAPPGIGCPWILPLTEPLRTKAWNVPMDEWEHHVKLPNATDSDSAHSGAMSH